MSELMLSAQNQNFPMYADNPRWMADGSCASVGSDFWFPEAGGGTSQAKRICKGCPVKAECLAYALEHNELFGVWGEKSDHQRRALRKSAA